MANQPQSGPAIASERVGTIAVITPTPAATALAEAELAKVADAILTPMQSESLTGMVIDLSKVDFFGSVFISFMLRCHTLIKKKQGRMLLAGATTNIREMLHLTALDSLWPMHKDRAEAVQMLAGGKK